ncbi:RDD family protein [Paludibacterium purpuratum]|uniref:Putative RDD family membrane protein YckC n=1 Tax=Paludibacterium purpuratum TaxID=1144873 RepID=A0A4R7BAB2_9NEIS|nr:RDD family protein [Paludibacterium purpuratum]TDR80567.1 putative RDD family membrane protein YckC [Paludibacterium purpuratum]
MTDQPNPPGIKRLLACLLYECLLMLALLLTTSALFTVPMVKLGNPSWLRYLEQLALLAALFAYFGLSWVRGGQTVAMKAWRLQLARADGAPIGWGLAAFRFTVALVLIIGVPIAAYLGMGAGNPHAARLALLWCAVPFAWRYFDPRHQTLHDRLCGTRLFLRPRAPRPPR